MRKMNDEIVAYESKDVVSSKNPEQLIALALEKQADPTTLEKLMDLQERWEAGNARKAFVVAMTGFKQEAPAVLVKGDKVDFQSSKGRTHYNYANLGSIVQEISALLGKHGLSASWETCQDERDNVVVTCHITHAAGHRESVTLRGPADDSGNKNRIQSIGSTVTYLQRYTLLAALGLATGEDDDDKGGKDGKPPITPPQAKKPEVKTETTSEGNLSVKATVEKTSSKEGKKGNKVWVLYGILANGIWYNTFDKKLYEIAEMQKGKEVEIVYQIAEKGNNLIAIKFEGCTGNPATCEISNFEGDKPFCGDNAECQYGIANA